MLFERKDGMLETKIELQLDKRSIQQHIEKQLDEAIQSQLWLVSVERLVQLTDMSKRWLEDEILCDPRMRAIERKKNRKRWYLAQQAFEVINEITAEW
ncbi:hypothetical protein ACIQZG_20905 [Lysinibacillus sp. NPDC096418]|uniref:hypothetical protein n=1 Tax=Lysinibacillus sp. NPDC096418 TaxID=3364138 RepID=UPI003826780D